MVVNVVGRRIRTAVVLRSSAVAVGSNAIAVGSNAVAVGFNAVRLMRWTVSW